MKKRRILAVLMIVALAVASFSGCGKKKEKEEPKKETKQVVQEEEEPEEVEEEPEVNQETFAIFGVDSRENNLGKGTRSDSLMVVNVDNTNKKVYIASVYRDCYVQIEGHGLDKITHAHSFGGPELAMDTLNTNFDLDIQKYITVNFMNVAELVDDMDGIEQDITEEETKYINGYIDELNGIRGTSSAHRRLHLAVSVIQKEEIIREVKDREQFSLRFSQKHRSLTKRKRSILPRACLIKLIQTI